ncbi:LOW QUALITY PROTEIN: mitochondrial fission factor-like [Paramacrobiotus metropolitanus]|uniref:LOW QUALITY PROTEIN: mitochondrial fission factor-like n=1 Tax=Paramacrobiotus metropolitanus TaxID=2943436 RepID=UPI002445CA13|nr:LOW QUALITY PROTEIN: mitochondrial fission factor-like [Paramacrobiotus metropolitanus]
MRVSYKPSPSHYYRAPSNCLHYEYNALRSDAANSLEMVDAKRRVTFEAADHPVNGVSKLSGQMATAPITTDGYFGENVGRHMRVPNQIRPYDDDAAHPVLQGSAFNARGSITAHQMNVPDRILVAGNDQHMGLRDQRPRELDFDDMLYGFRTDVAVPVHTPPRTLTVGQHEFLFPDSQKISLVVDGPVIAPFFGSALTDNNIEQAMIAQAERNMIPVSRTPKSVTRRSASAVATPTSVRAALPDTPGGRLVVDLYKRVEALERENYRRYLREMLSYALIIGYAAMKGLSFFLKR